VSAATPATLSGYAYADNNRDNVMGAGPSRAPARAAVALRALLDSLARLT
jgi:hypothetical protein